MRDISLYFRDILAAIESVDAFVEGMDLNAFYADDKTSSAVIRKREIAGMRDRLIHFYVGVDYDLVWKTIKERFPEAKLQIQTALNDLT